MLSDSFRIKNFWRIFSIELIRYLIILIVVFAGMGLFIKSFYNMQPLLNVIDAMRATGDYELYSSEFNNNIHMFNNFILNSSLIIILGVIVLVFINSICDNFIINLNNKKTFDFRFLMHFFYIYMILSLIFIAAGIFALIKIVDLYLLAIIIIFLFVLYAYLILIVQSSIDSKKKFHQNVLISLRNFLRLNMLWEPVFFSIFAYTMLFLISLILIWAIKGFAFIIIIFGMICYVMWTRNYFIKTLSVLKKHKR